MKQIWATRSGDPAKLKIVESGAAVPRNGEVRIRIEAAGISELDLVGPAGISGPYVPGQEVAGVVESVGQGVTTVSEGEPVLALVANGGYANFINVAQQQVYRRLDWMNAADGTALPVDYLSAYLMLVVMGSLRPGTRVLIRASHTGAGGAAIDICRIVGAETITTAPLPFHDALKTRGAGAVIDDTKEHIVAAVNAITNEKGVHIILDPTGGRGWRPFYALLMPTGRYVYMITRPEPVGRLPLISALRRRWQQPRLTHARQRHDSKALIGLRRAALMARPELTRRWMAQIIEWYDEALFRPTLDRTFALTEASAAHSYLKSRNSLGKVVLAPNGATDPDEEAA